MKTFKLIFLLILWGCTSSPRKDIIVNNYYLITGGDTLKIQDSLVSGSYSKYEILNQVRSIDSVIAKVDSSIFFVNETKFELQVKKTFKIETDSAISIKGYYMAINDGNTEKDFFGIYVEPIGTISFKAYESNLVLRLFQINQRNLTRLQDLSDSVVLRHIW